MTMRGPILCRRRQSSQHQLHPKVQEPTIKRIVSRRSAVFLSSASNTTFTTSTAFPMTPAAPKSGSKLPRKVTALTTATWRQTGVARDGNVRSIETGLLQLFDHSGDAGQSPGSNLPPIGLPVTSPTDPNRSDRRE